jgi:DNA-binding GntR family transcriptional regulator
MLRVYEALREQILDGSLPQGAPVSIQAISAEMQSSNGPVISALTRLSHEGLVQHRRGAGYHVARWTPEMLEGLLTVRRALETEAARLAARRAGPEDLQQLAAHIARMGELVCERRRAAADAADVEFHIAVAQLSRCPALIDALKRSHLLESGDFDNLAINHQVLLDAIASGDPDRAGRAMHLHLSGPIPLHWPTASE